MNEEVMKVLAMLDEGKISAEEAERLIDILNPSRMRRPPRPPKMPKDFVEKIERIPEIISTKLEELNIDAEIERVKKEFFGQEGQEKYEDVKKVVINQTDGDLTVTGTDKTYTVLTSVGKKPRAVRGKASLVLNNTEGDLEVLPPNEARIVINSMQGDTRVTGLKEGFVAQLYSGDLEGTLDGGKTGINSYSGDINLVIRENTKAKINSYSGDVELQIDPDLDLEVVTIVRSGDFDSEEEAESLGEGRHRLMFGEGTYRVLVQSFSGDINITKSQPKTKTKDKETDSEG